jgi:branched-chain amino acid transport system ATP-binding protein
MFGGLTAVNQLDFDIFQGEILGLIGPNGAGKTTIYNLISGVLKPTRGKVFYKGQNITGISCHRLASLGIVRTFQHTNLFREMTVFASLVMAHHLHTRATFWGALFDSNTAREDRHDLEQRAEGILEYMGLNPFRNELAKNLPHGHQRALGVALGLATNPELLLLDEPLTGMNPQEVTTMLRMIRGIREKDITIVVVEHNMKAIMGLSDRIVAINFGQKIAEGIPDEVQNNRDVIEAYLGAGEVV